MLAASRAHAALLCAVNALVLVCGGAGEGGALDETRAQGKKLEVSVLEPLLALLVQVAFRFHELGEYSTFL